MVVTIFGNITAEEALTALKKAFPKRNIQTASSFSRSSISTLGASDVQILNVELHEIVPTVEQQKRNEDFHEIKQKLEKANINCSTAQKQQNELLDDFVTLRNKYDETKASLVTILWTHCCRYHPDLVHIPEQEDEKTFIETEKKVGNIDILKPLGEGQFASVFSCVKSGNPTELALKVISKDRIFSFKSLSRVSNEIAHLNMLSSPHIVSLVQAYQTASKLYLLTEKGGVDLFDFFDNHPDGVGEKVAKKIFGAVLKGVFVCHENMICHRGTYSSSFVFVLLVYFVCWHWAL
jgi:hypothetical protein